MKATCVIRLLVVLCMTVGTAQAQSLVPHETFPDCDQDGNADIFWNNMAAGNSDFTVWYMQGASFLSAQTIAGPVDSNWKSVGMGDYKNTQKPQIVWRNLNSGRLVIWWSNQCPQHTGGVLEAWSPDEADPNWKVQSMSDLGSLALPTDQIGDPAFDHLNDIVWQYLSAYPTDRNFGQLRVWYTKEVAGAGNGFIYDARPLFPEFPDSSAWVLVGGGDFGTTSTVPTPDNDTDLLFQNQTTRALQIWFMNSNARVEKFDVAAVPPTGCRVVAVADYGTDATTTTRDVDADIVLDCGTSYMTTWFMNGAAKVDQATVINTVPGGQWLVVHPQ